MILIHLSTCLCWLILLKARARERESMMYQIGKIFSIQSDLAGRLEESALLAFLVAHTKDGQSFGFDDCGLV